MKYVKVFLLSLFSFIILLSSVSFAETSATPYFEIAQDYSSNPFKAERSWLGKNIAVESEIAGGIGNSVITFSQENTSGKYKRVEYDFYFRNGFDKTLSLQKGQKIKIIGQICKLIVSTFNNNQLFILMDNSKIIK